MKTARITPANLSKKWVLVDATNQVLGRLSSEIASVLIGKRKPNFVRHLDNGDNVVVINADKIRLTGSKLRSKVYYHHTNFIGSLKAARAEEVLAKHPERLIEEAVKGMLPKNKLGKKLFGNLNVYAGANHPHTAQNPQPLTPRTASV